MNGKQYRTGDRIPWVWIYPLFLVHMLVFGATAFVLAYRENGIDVLAAYVWGIFAVPIYLVFYRAIFGTEEVKWMVVNAALGVFGVYQQLGWILGIWGKSVDSYPVFVHVVPFVFYVLYTFLLRHALLDLAGAVFDYHKQKIVNRYYVGLSLAVYGLMALT